MSAGGSTATDIANEALGLIGVVAIADISDEESTAASACRRMLPTTRKSLFRMHPWNCLLARTITAPESEIPSWGFLYRHRLPANCLRLYRINSEELPSSRYKVEGDFILANSSVLKILYVKDTDNYALLSSDLYEALSIKLALKIHRLMGVKTKNVMHLHDLFEEVIGDALASDSSETSPYQSEGADDLALYRQGSGTEFPRPTEFIEVDEDLL